MGLTHEWVLERLERHRWRPDFSVTGVDAAVESSLAKERGDKTVRMYLWKRYLSVDQLMAQVKIDRAFGKRG